MSRAAFFINVADTDVAEGTEVTNEDANEEPKEAIIEDIPIEKENVPCEVDEVTQDQLKSLAYDLNPGLGFYDPLKLAEARFWTLPNSDTVGFLRHAEIKHGRVAMAAFVGYCVQSNWHFPWKMTLAGDDFPSVDLSPEAQWDAISLNAKLQIIAVIGFLEFWDELGGNIAESRALGMEKREHLPHYTKGRMPGQYPSFKNFRDTVHWVPDLYDPFDSIGRNKKMTQEMKEKGRLAEINNGRLAMIAIMAFLAADKVPGAVPLLNNVARVYDGNTMIPFSNDFTLGIGPAVVDSSVGNGANEAASAAGTVSISELAGSVPSTTVEAPVEIVQRVVEQATGDSGSFVAQLLSQ